MSARLSKSILRSVRNWGGDEPLYNLAWGQGALAQFCMTNGRAHMNLFQKHHGTLSNGEREHSPASTEKIVPNLRSKGMRQQKTQKKHNGKNLFFPDRSSDAWICVQPCACMMQKVTKQPAMIQSGLQDCKFAASAKPTRRAPLPD